MDKTNKMNNIGNIDELLKDMDFDDKDLGGMKLCDDSGEESNNESDIENDEIDDEVEKYFKVEDEMDESKDKKNKKKKKKKDKVIIGIDLGTTHSCVSIWRNGRSEIIMNGKGRRTIPSVVSFTETGEYVGMDALNQKAFINPENTYYDVKRLIGRKMSDDVVQGDLQFLTYNLESDDKDNIYLSCKLKNRKKKYTPEEISARILCHLKNLSEEYLKREITDAVITVPAYFNDSQRQATKDASQIAGLNCVRIINEPTAAALSYGLEKASLQNNEEEINVIVYDLGGGTLDVSLLTIENGVFQVLGSTGNTHLGGEDFDNRLLSWSIDMFKRMEGVSKLGDIENIKLQRLKKSCENAKKLLSVTNKSTIAVADFWHGKDLLIPITKKQFEHLCKDLFIICLKPVEDVLKSSGFTRDDVDEIVLVGGATRMPRIRKNLEVYFGGKKPNCNVNPDEVVARGAAIQAYILAEKKNPFTENIQLLDVIPLSLGVKTIGGVMSTMVPRNSVIPLTKKKKFTTDSDYETSVMIEIYEGERKMTKDNYLLGKFKLDGLEEAPRGVAQLEVTFHVDVNGILQVTAKDCDNEENENSITITENKGRLTADEISELVKEAKRYEMEDKLERYKKRYYYEIDDLCSNILINLKNDEFKLKKRDQLVIEEDVTKILEWLKEKTYKDRNKKEYIDVLQRIKRKYGTLMLKVTNENSDVKDLKSGADSGIKATGLFDDDEEEDIFERIEDEEIGITSKMEKREKEELKELRQSLLDLCESINGIVRSSLVKISEEDGTDLKNIIDDVMMWVYIADKIERKEYVEKIDYVNSECNKIVNKYQMNKDKIFEDNYVKTQIENSRQELEQLCFALKSSIVSNMFTVDDDELSKLEKTIDATLEWLIEMSVKDQDKEDNKDNENVYKKKINEINELCDKMYHNMVGIDMKKIKESNQSKSVFVDPEALILDDDNGEGLTMGQLEDMEDEVKETKDNKKKLNDQQIKKKSDDQQVKKKPKKRFISKSKKRNIKRHKAKMRKRRR